MRLAGTLLAGLALLLVVPATAAAQAATATLQAPASSPAPAADATPTTADSSAPPSGNRIVSAPAPLSQGQANGLFDGFLVHGFEAATTGTRDGLRTLVDDANLVTNTAPTWTYQQGTVVAPVGATSAPVPPTPAAAVATPLPPTSTLRPSTATPLPTATPVPTATPSSRQFTLSLHPTPSVFGSGMPSYLPLDRMLGIGDTATIHLSNQPVEVTLQTVELGERSPIQVDIDRRIYATFGFVDHGDAPLDFDPLTVFAGVPDDGRIGDRARIMDPVDTVHLDPNTPQAIRWRWRVATNHAVNGATSGRTVWLTLNAPIDYTGPYVTMGADSIVFRVDLPGEPPTSNFSPPVRTRAPTTTALPPGTPLPRR